MDFSGLKIKLKNKGIKFGRVNVAGLQGEGGSFSGRAPKETTLERADFLAVAQRS